VHHGALASVTQVMSPEEALIRSHCRFSPVPIFIGDEQMSQGLRFALHVPVEANDLRFSPRIRRATKVIVDGAPVGYAGMRYAGKQAAVVHILTNGVLAERFELGDSSRRAAPDFGAIVDVDLPKDLGQAKVLRGPEYTQVLDAIWAAHAKVAPAKFGDATGGTGEDEPRFDRGPEGMHLPLVLVGIGVVVTMLGFGYAGWLTKIGLVIGAIGGLLAMWRMPGLVK
jgi:hypothetical protein